MQYKNYLPYATSMESPPPELTATFSFSLKEEKRPKGKKKIQIPQNILVPKSGTCKRQYSTCNLFGLKRLKAARSHHSVPGLVPHPPTPSPLRPRCPARFEWG